MKLIIISSEVIKPSSPTPHHLKTHQLSLLDQLTPDVYIPFLLFYSGVDNKSTQISYLLKKSLSATLTYYYPFAGRIKDDFSVDCDDSGVLFTEVKVASKMSEVLKNPEIDILEELMPFNPSEMLSTRVNLAVQLNYFDCGGVAICALFRHLITDAAAAIYFLNNWSKVACGSSDIKDVVFDATSIFPPNDVIPSISRSVNEKQRSTECITERFTFDGAKIDALREKIGNSGSNLYRPTRFEAVSTIIWGALISIAKANNDSLPVVTIPVNLRTRMNPALPQQCIGNMYHAMTANVVVDKEFDYNGLARNLNELTKMVNDDFVRTLYEGGVFVNHYTKAAKEFVNTSSKITVFGFSGPLGLPYYEVDFGWGKPTLLTIPMRLNNTAILSEASNNGKGVDAWVGLPKKDVAKFEKDAGILSYASFNPGLRSAL